MTTESTISTPVKKTPDETMKRYLEKFGPLDARINADNAGYKGFPKLGADKQYRDASRRLFNPLRHRVGPDGVPICGPQGNFAPLKREERNPAAVQPASEEPSPQAAPHGPQDAPRAEIPPPTPPPLKMPAGAAPDGLEMPADEFTQTALEAVALEEMASMAVFGEEWQFLPPEKQLLTIAWAKTFRVKGKVDLPWWVQLAAAHALVVGQRLNQPKTKSRLERWSEKLKTWLPAKAR